MATIAFVHAHPDDEAITHRRLDGPRLRRRPPGRARRLHQRRARRGARRPRRGRDARRPPSSRDRALRRASRGAPDRLARLPRLRDDRLGRRTTIRGRSSRPTSTRRPSGWPSVLREEQADVVVLYDWHGDLRAPRPRPGAPGRARAPPIGRRLRSGSRSTFNRDAARAGMAEMAANDARLRGLRPVRSRRRRQPVRHCRRRRSISPSTSAGTCRRSGRRSPATPAR